MDYHYSLFYFSGRTFYLSETATVLVFLSAAALLLFLFLVYSLISRRMLIIQWRIFMRHIWVVGLLFLLLAVSLFLAELWSALVKKLLALDGYADLLLMAAKILCAIAFYNLLVPYFSRLRIPRKGNYFGSAAALLTVTGSMIAAVLDLSFVLLFLWACLFAFLGSIFRKAPLVIGAALLTPLELLAALANLAGRGYTRIFEIMDSGSLSITLYTVLTVLPCFLLLHRAEYLSGRTRHAAGNAGKRLIRRLIAAGASLLIFFSLALWFSRQPRQEGERKILIDEDERFLVLKAESGVFLDRRIISLRVEAKEEPRLFTLKLESPDKALIIYDTPMPYRFAPDNKSVVFILGEEPDNPFRTELVLPQDFSGSLRAEAVYTSPPDGEAGKEGDIHTVVRIIPVP
jgi:hypothetical protein